MLKVRMLERFERWFKRLDRTQRDKVLSRLSILIDSENFGTHRQLSQDLYELKWRVSIRVYYTVSDSREVILICGGNKDSQARDIEIAKKELKALYENEN